MQRNQLSDLSIFVEVARAKGFRAAAENLKLGAGSVSEAVQRFEDRVGVRLFDRTTRRIALTGAGERLYQRSLPAILDLEDAVRDLNETQNNVSGTLRLSAPPGCGPFFLDNLISRFADANPNVDIDIMYDEEKVDLVASGIDAAIRTQILLEQDTHAVPVGPELDMVIVGSPGFFEEHGVPAKPSDLPHFKGICFAIGAQRRLASWNFKGPDGIYSVVPEQRILVNDPQSLLRFAEAGLGLTYVYARTAEPYIKSGRLLSVLQQDLAPFSRFTINYLSKKNMPNRLRAFIDLAKKVK